MSQKKFKIKTSDNLFDKFLFNLLKLFKAKHNIILPSEKALPRRAIYVSNHSGAEGPLSIRMYLPVRMMIWGAHQMLGNYKERTNYLYHVFYRQKLRFDKVRSFILTYLFGIISKIAYSAGGVLPVHFDTAGLRRTMQYSLECLHKDISIVIFPEDASEGYQARLVGVQRGFLVLSKLFFKQTGEDLPIYPVYCRADAHTMYVGEPMYYQELKNKYREDGAILNLFTNAINNLNPENCKADVSKSVS